MNYKVLLVDDEAYALAATKRLLEQYGYRVETADNGEEAIDLVRKSPRQYALAILDYRLGAKDGAATAEEIRAINQEIYILIYSGDESRDALKSTWDAGAVAFVEKKPDYREFLQVVRNWCFKYEQTLQTLEPSIEMNMNEELISSIGMVGRSDALASIAKRILRYQREKVTANTLVLGETGTGKELVARALHSGTTGSFCAVNCAKFRQDLSLMESELFGYVKGAFTGANTDKKGIFEKAENGMLLLDEIHTLGLNAQERLLRALQEKAISPVGSSREYPINFRLVSAAKADIEQRVKNGTFLRDLYYRIKTISIQIPPLSERREDIEPLISHFTERFNAKHGKSKRFLMRTVRQLEKYHWPGNVRELENYVCALLIESHSNKISLEHLDAKFFEPDQIVEFTEATSLKRKFEAITKSKIAEALNNSRSQREAAKRVGLPWSTFKDAVKKFELNAPPRRKKKRVVR